MKPILLLPLVLTLPAFAGTPAPVTAPPSNPCLTSWFAGASVGWLTELEEPMYNVHLGVTNSCWILGGWNASLFLEVGYTNTEFSQSANIPHIGGGPTHTDTLTMEDDVTIVPITFNAKLERVLTGNLKAYFGAGLGVAWVDDDRSRTLVHHSNPITSSHTGVSDSDWVFTAQVFAGLSYAVTPNFEIYGGGRWIYLADPNLFGVDQSVDDDWLLELGARFKF